MGKGYMYIEEHQISRWFIKGKSLENIKELLQLPENFQVDGISPAGEHGLKVFVSSPDIPEIPGNEIHAKVEPEYIRVNNGSILISGIWIYPQGFKIACAQSKEALEAVDTVLQ
jgi:hypothetical protein